MAYDYGGLLVSRQGPSGITTFIWDGDTPFAQQDGAGIQLFTQGGELLRAVGAQPDGTPINRQFHLDMQGTVQATTLGTQATETNYVMDAFGNLISGSAAGNHYDYMGGLGYWHDPDLGLTYVRARWLDTETGSWMSADPLLGEPGYSHNYMRTA